MNKNNNIELYSDQNSLIYEVIEYLQNTNPQHLGSFINYLPLGDVNYTNKVEELLSRFNQFMIELGKDFKYGLECYNRKTYDLMEEYIDFTKTGKYRYTSFDEVNNRVYNNVSIMEYHTIGLLLMQILRANNYKKLCNFIYILSKKKNDINDYLEIAGGHGLYTYEAYKILPEGVNIDFIDISNIAIKIAKSFLKGIKINFYCQNIFFYEPNKKYDFITVGEILEHLENPQELLLKIKYLLTDSGLCFITVPINMPAIDHIFLFKNKEEISQMILNSGLKILNEFYEPEFPDKHNQDRNLPYAYWAIVSK